MVIGFKRLELHAADNPEAATITPFSNNATIASYPVLARDNELPSRLSTGKLHSFLLQTNDGKTIYAPTAVGFGMWVRRKAWQQAGGFDTIFGRGYGKGRLLLQSRKVRLVSPDCRRRICFPRGWHCIWQ